MPLPWPEGTLHVSGPASMYMFLEPTSGHFVYLFGDVHFSYKNACTLLDSKQTISISQLLLNVLKNRGTLLVEFPADMGEKMDWYEKKLKASLEMNSRVSTHVSNLIHRLFGIPSPVTGNLSHLYSILGNHKHIIGIDARNSPSVHVFDSMLRRCVDQDALANAFFQDIKPKSIRKWFNAFITASNFSKEFKEVFSAVELLRPWIPKSLPKGRHAIGKTIHTIDNARMKQKVYAFSKQQCSEVVKLFSQLSKRQHSSTQDLQKFVLGCQAALMDCYAVAQLVHHLKIGDVALYAGDYHAERCCDFLKDCNLQILVESPIKHVSGGILRCTSLPNL
jgi:hypothetical protein